MLQLTIDQEVIEQMAREAIEQRVKEIENTLFFMTTKEVLRYTGMSWNSFNDIFMSDSEFTAAIRLGNKWLFNKEELDSYLDKFFIAVRDSGGDINRYKRR